MHHLDRICDIFECAWRRGESPLIEDYLPQVTITLRVALLEELIAQEVDRRQAAGEKVAIQTYLERFPADNDAVKRGLALAPQKAGTCSSTSTTLAPVRLKVYQRKRLAYLAYVTKPLEIGRQRPAEPPPYARVPVGEGERLVIAPLQETRVSRQHLYLEWLKPGLVRITSRTTKGDIGLESTRLFPGDSAEVKLPTLLIIGEYVIRLESR